MLEKLLDEALVIWRGIKIVTTRAEVSVGDFQGAKVFGRNEGFE